MSWQEFVDDHLMVELPNGGTLQSAAIVGSEGDVWAQSSGFPELTTAEAHALQKGYTDPGELAQHGMYVGGTKYMAIAGDPGAVHRGKKGSGGVTVAKTASAMVIGIYSEGVQPADCSIVVEKMAEYLKEQGM